MPSESSAWDVAPPAYNLKEFKRQLFQVLAMLLFLKFTKGYGILVYIPIAITAAASAHRHVAMLFSVYLFCTMYVNTTPAIFSRSGMFLIVVRFIFLIFFLVLSSKASGKKWPLALRPVSLLLMYLVFQAGASMAGWAPLVSELKIVLMAVFILAGASACSIGAAGEVDVDKVRATVLVCAFFFIVVSLLLYPFPGISRSMDMTALNVYFAHLSEAEKLQRLQETAGLYNGVAFHSQSLGPIAAVLFSFVLADYVFNIRRKAKLYYAIMLCAPVVVYMAGSRTAMGALLFAVLFCAFLSQGAKTAAGSKKAWIMSVVMGFSVLAFVLFAAAPGFKQKVVDFSMKYGKDKQFNVDEMLSTRMGKIEQSMYYFRQSPIIGNGFQVSKSMQERKFDSLSQLSSVPVEKGFMPAYVLEEGGIIGGALMLAFVLAFYSAAKKNGCYCFLATMSTFLVSNCGEGTFFSVTATGGVCWAACFSALMVDIGRQKQLAHQVY